MKILPFGASYERGLRLEAAGCPLDYLESLPRNTKSVGPRLRVEQLGGEDVSRVYDYGNGTVGYSFSARLGTDRAAGVIISNWEFVPPWRHDIDWDIGPYDVVPGWQQSACTHLFKSSLLDVLNKRRILRRGHPVEGLLCGCAFLDPKEHLEFSLAGASYTAEFRVTDEFGDTYTETFELTVDRTPAIRRAHQRKVRSRRSSDRKPLNLTSVAEEQVAGPSCDSNFATLSSAR
jgi:hypothetical protein